MKKILLMFILLSSLAYASHPEELDANPKLMSFIDDSFGNHDVRIVNLKYAREVKVEGSITILQLSVKQSGIISKGLIVYDTIPKELVSNAKTDIISVNTQHAVIENDPIIAHYISNFSQDMVIEYRISKKLPPSLQNITFTSPPLFIISVDKDRELGEKFVNIYDSLFIVYAFMLFGLVTIIFLIVKLRNLEKEDKEGKKKEDKEDNDTAKSL